MKASQWNGAVHRGHPSPRPVPLHGHSHGVKATRREWTTGGLAMLLVGSPTARAEEVAMITKKVAMEFGLCNDKPNERTLGETSFCSNVMPLGWITFGLFGDRLPITVDNFVKTVESGSYDGTIIQRVFEGEFLSAGKQGSKRLGEVEAPSNLQSNPELVSSKAFELKHRRPGTLSLAIDENEDSTDRTLSGDYHPTQFLVTTGPGPAPRLDNGNVVFGRVVDGFDILRSVAAVRTYKPSTRVRAFNAFAKAIGDERAAEVRKTWGRPIQPIVITSTRVLPN